MPLSEIARFPVCRACLDSLEPLCAEFLCARCHTPFLNSAPLDENGECSLCRLELAGFDDAYSYGFYDGTLRRLIHLFKYDRITTLAAPLGAVLTRALPLDSHFDAVVPMPMHWRRRWQRGFNQAELLARQLARRTGMPVAAAVKRARPTASQAGLTAAARRRNVSGVFQVSHADAVAGRSLLLVDDVLTTGATARACAASLKQAGAARVTVLTVARADRRTWSMQIEPHSIALGVL